MYGFVTPMSGALEGWPGFVGAAPKMVRTTPPVQVQLFPSTTGQADRSQASTLRWAVQGQEPVTITPGVGRKSSQIPAGLPGAGITVIAPDAVPFQLFGFGGYAGYINDLAEVPAGYAKIEAATFGDLALDDVVERTAADYKAVIQVTAKGKFQVAPDGRVVAGTEDRVIFKFISSNLSMEKPNSLVSFRAADPLAVGDIAYRAPAGAAGAKLGIPVAEGANWSTIALVAGGVAVVGLGAWLLFGQKPASHRAMAPAMAGYRRRKRKR